MGGEIEGTWRSRGRGNFNHDILYEKRSIFNQVLMQYPCEDLSHTPTLSLLTTLINTVSLENESGSIPFFHTPWSHQHLATCHESYAYQAYSARSLEHRSLCVQPSGILCGQKQVKMIIIWAESIVFLGFDDKNKWTVYIV